MSVLDWMNAVINLAIGILLGSALYGLAQLVASGSWLMAMTVLLLAASLLLLVVLSDKLFDRVLPVGIRPAKTPQAQRPKPLLRVLSLPSGFILGIALASLGLDRVLLDFLP